MTTSADMWEPTVGPMDTEVRMPEQIHYPADEDIVGAPCDYSCGGDIYGPRYRDQGGRWRLCQRCDKPNCASEDER